MGGNESRESSRQDEEIENGAASSGESELSKGTVAAGGIAGLVALGVAGLLSGSTSSGGQRKTIKAPGRDQRIYRDDFERDTASYFKDLRKDMWACGSTPH